jgi:hypothetical protein
MMGKARSRKWMVIIGLILEIGSNGSPISAAPQTVTYRNPIAYIGLDGNVYVTNLDNITSTPLTTDGYVTPREHHYNSSFFRYGGIHWSPDGTQFSFVDTMEHKLYVVQSGKGGVQVPGAAPSSYTWQSALSPDNTKIAFLTEKYEDLVTMPVAGGEPTTIGGIPGLTTERPDLDPAEMIRANELNYTAFDAPYTLEWTKYGILVLSSVAYTGRMWDLKGNELWRAEGTSDYEDPLPLISADRTSALIKNGYGDVGHATINLANGHLTALSIPAEARILAWTPDGKYVIYETRSDPLTVFDPDHGSFDYVENTLSLWQFPVTGGEPTLIFQRRGYDFGVVRVTADSKSLVFSLVTSSVNKVQAKLRHAPQAVQDALEDAHPEIIQLPLQKGAVPRWIALGGNLAIGKGNFAVPVLSSSASQTSLCTTVAAPRLKVGQRAKVIANITLYSQPLFYDSGYYAFMSVNAGKEVLVAGGAQCDDKGIVWWKVNYQSIVGWTPAGEVGKEWFEQ